MNVLNLVHIAPNLLETRFVSLNLNSVQHTTKNFMARQEIIFRNNSLENFLYVTNVI